MFCTIKLKKIILLTWRLFLVFKNEYNCFWTNSPRTKINKMTTDTIICPSQFLGTPFVFIFTISIDVEFIFELYKIKIAASWSNSTKELCTCIFLMLGEKLNSVWLKKLHYKMFLAWLKFYKKILYIAWNTWTLLFYHPVAALIPLGTCPTLKGN